MIYHTNKQVYLLNYLQAFSYANWYLCNMIQLKLKIVPYNRSNSMYYLSLNTRVGMFLPWMVITKVKTRFVPLQSKYFLPFHFGKKWKKLKMVINQDPNIDLSFLNLTNINILFLLFIHICTLKKLE